jgi:pilus assembly protein CpaE
MRGPDLPALLIAPNRELAQAFLASHASAGAFQLLGDLKAYPTSQTLEIRLRQLQPAVILVDLVTDLAAACEVIAGCGAAIQVVGLHLDNDPEALIRSLRAGAAEFLYAPFDANQQREAVARLWRLRNPEPPQEVAQGKVIAFTSAKPGSGASTLATQTAFALHKLTRKRILLIDCDLMGGAVGFYLKVTHSSSLADLLEAGPQAAAEDFSRFTVHSGGIEIIAAPEQAQDRPAPLDSLRDVLEQARSLYDWVILDLPAVFSRLALAAIPESETTYIVSTAELPSLHLARKAVSLMNQAGIEKGRFQVVINRLNKRDNISSSDMEKIFNCPVHASFPNDYFSLHRVVTLGTPLGGESELGRSIEALAARITGRGTAEKSKKPGAGSLLAV